MTSFPEEWTRCKHWIEAALEYADGAYTIEDVEREIVAGNMHFFPQPASASVTEMAEFPGRRFLNVVLAGGELKEIVAMVPRWKAWAAFLGCDALKVAGRPGWARALGAGWKTSCVVLTTPVKD
jgi:hypothetical protein